MKNKYFVYMHICPNKKVYIGITYNTKQRWGNNGRGYKKNRLFYRAIKKYGWENIEHNIIFGNLTLEQAKAKEIELIKKYNATNAKFGYNISLGGDLTTTGYKFSKKQRENISKAKFMPIYCIEDDKYFNTRKELIDNKMQGCYKCASGERNSYLGKHYIFVKDMQKYKNGEIIFMEDIRKKVVCLETQTIYNSISEAAKKTNSSPNSISQCCKNKLKSTNKLHWQYYDKNFDFDNCENMIIKKMKINNPKSKKVICIETGKIYDSPSQANIETGIFHIAECCKNERKTAGGYKWRYADEI